MNFHDFAGEVQHRTEGAELGEGVRNARAVLQTLGERLSADEAKDLASPLPMEIDRFVTDVEHGQHFGWTEFVHRVAERANAEPSDAAFYAKAVVALLYDLEPAGEILDIRNSLPVDEYEDLFELVDVEEAAAPW